MIFSDDVICEYYRTAWEYGRVNKIPHNENPYVIEAETEVRRWLNFSYSMDWKLLGYTKTRRAANSSKLIINTCAYEFGEYDHLAYGLLRLYGFFADKSANNLKSTGMPAVDGLIIDREELIAA
jgi:hypothetical protein